MEDELDQALEICLDLKAVLVIERLQYVEAAIPIIRAATTVMRSEGNIIDVVPSRQN